MANPVVDGFLPFPIGEEKDWPTLRASQAQALSLENADFNLEPNRQVLFGGNGQISAVGDLSFLTGAPSPVQQLRIFANGTVGIGTGTRQPSSKLEIAGTLKLDDGVEVDKFSDDISSDGESNKAVPTAKAVKTYVDGKASSVPPDGSVTSIKLAKDAVTADNIKNGTITEAKLGFSLPSGSSQWQGEDGGSLYYSNGKVGIGTNSPTAQLNVDPKGAGGIAIGKNDKNGGYTSLSLTISAEKGGYASIQSIKSSGKDWGNLVLNSAGGNVGVGTDKPSAKLNVDPKGTGGITIGNSDDKNGGYTSLSLTISAEKGGDASIQSIKSSGKDWGKLKLNPSGGVVEARISAPSSKELKENIIDLSAQEALETLSALNPAKFNYRLDKDKRLSVGFIAEDMPVLLAAQDKKTVSTLDIVAVLTKVIQQQQQELLSMKERLNILESIA